MSREYQDFLDIAQEDTGSRFARRFARGGDGVRRYVQCFIADEIYVYLYEDGDLIQVQHVPIPERWSRRWPADESTVRRYVHRHATIGSAPITSLDA